MWGCGVIRIYGASDDLVEIEDSAGDGDEIDCYDRGVEILVDDPHHGGVIVRADYAPKGAGAVWQFGLRQLDEDVPIPWPVHIEAKGYSVHVVIECPPGTPYVETGKKRAA